MTLMAAWLLGCTVALPAYGLLRRSLSPWSSVDDDNIVMLSSDHCATSRKALRLVESDSRLSRFIVPVPANGAGVHQPRTCASALQSIGMTRPHVNWLPRNLACHWLKEDVDRALQGEAVPTPSWYFRGEVITFENETREKELFRGFGWEIEWTSRGLRLDRIGEERRRTSATESIESLEDLGINPFRPSPS